MAEKAKPVPDGFHTLTPHLTVRDAEKAIDFYQKAFGAEVRGKNHAPDGKKIIHASLKIGDSMLMLNDEFPEWGPWRRRQPAVLVLPFTCTSTMWIPFLIERFPPERLSRCR